MIERYADAIAFFVPDVALAEAEEHLPNLIRKRGGDPEKALGFLRLLAEVVDIIEHDVYGEFETEARNRLGERDQEDWPILAAALALGCPIWTEDTDFFGCGVATWTTASVQLFLSKEQK